MSASIKLTKQAEYHLSKLHKTVSQVLGMSYDDPVLIARAIQNYRILFMAAASRVLSRPPKNRKIALAKFIESEVDRLNQIEVDLMEDNDPYMACECGKPDIDRAEYQSDF